jgi:hypothetical protein
LLNSGTTAEKEKNPQFLDFSHEGMAEKQSRVRTADPTTSSIAICQVSGKTLALADKPASGTLSPDIDQWT